jgi:hypothetical protein
MIPWLCISAIFVFQGVARIRRWPTAPIPLPFAIGLSVFFVVLTRFVAKPYRPPVLIVGAVTFMDAAVRLIRVAPLTEGIVLISGAGLLLLYTFRHQSQLAHTEPTTWRRWKILALIGLAVFLLLPPGSC